MRKLLILITVLSTNLSYSQTQISMNTQFAIAEMVNSFKNNGYVTEEMRGRYPIHNMGGVEYVSFLATVNPSFDADGFSERGINIGSRVSNIVSMRYPLSDLQNVVDESSLSYVKLAGKLSPALDRVPTGTRVDSVWAGASLPQSYSGVGVLIGIHDWGFDFTHPMFYDTAMNEIRIFSVWDQFKTSGPAPSGYSYGTEYTNATDILAAQGDTFTVFEYESHGTHVAGIAGGSGYGTGDKGMAFGAQYLIANLLIDESFAMDGWQWMYDIAQQEGKNLVINCSYGVYHWGAPDGTDLLQQALDAFTDMGVVFTVAALNNGDVNFHIKHAFQSDTIQTQVEFKITSDPGHYGQSVHMWGEAGESFATQLVVKDGSFNELVTSPFYATNSMTGFVDSFLVTGSDTIFFSCTADDAYPSNGRSQMRLRVKYHTTSLLVGIRSTGTGTVHYWNLQDRYDDATNEGNEFKAFGNPSWTGNAEYGVGIPACATKAITVGAYASEYYVGSQLLGGFAGALSSYGPLLDESPKPDISAPGIGVVSSLSSFSTWVEPHTDSVEYNNKTYYFGPSNGTSQAAPAVAGIVALIWEANPYLSSAQIKDIIINTARTDNYTGAIPPHSTKWGNGKVDAHAAVQLALNTVGVNDIEKELNWTIYPNPTNYQLSISNVPNDIERLSIYDLSGKEIMILTQYTGVDISSLSSGTYFIRLVSDGRVEQRKLVVM